EIREDFMKINRNTTFCRRRMGKRNSRAAAEAVPTAKECARPGASPFFLTRPLLRRLRLRFPEKSRSFAAVVEGVEPVAVLVDDVAAADLQGGGDLAGLDLERAGQEQEGADPLGLAHGLHQLVDALLQEAVE